jgi:hypothetical protein
VGDHVPAAGDVLAVALPELHEFGRERLAAGGDLVVEEPCRTRTARSCSLRASIAATAPGGSTATAGRVAVHERR